MGDHKHMTIDESFKLAIKARERERAENIRKAIQDIEIQPDIVKAIADEFAETLRLALSTVKIHGAINALKDSVSVRSFDGMVKVCAEDISIDGGSYWHVPKPPIQ